MQVPACLQKSRQPLISRKCCFWVKKFEKIGLGGGCHWCTEGVFVSLRGVEKVDQGWIAGSAPHDTFSEAVIVHFDPAVISAEDLIAVHLETHASTVNHGLRHRYRSAIYAFSDQDRVRFGGILDDLRTGFSAPLVTEVVMFDHFRASPPEYQDYYRTDPNRPFCQNYISPKLRALRRRRPEVLSEEAVRALTEEVP
ncbi:peptide methionine sulfoxide reductase [Lewinella sp. W8]|nr:peptide methionine sulfoxide reductase [Lewinella sp. W8]